MLQPPQTENLVKIIIILSGILVSSWVVFGFFVIRLIKGYDDQIRDVYQKITDIPAIKTDINWLKDKKK